MALTEEDVFAALRDCYDPEIPVNIVDLGLIYGVKVAPDANSKRAFPRQRVEVDRLRAALPPGGGSAARNQPVHP